MMLLHNYDCQSRLAKLLITVCINYNMILVQYPCLDHIDTLSNEISSSTS